MDKVEPQHIFLILFVADMTFCSFYGDKWVGNSRMNNFDLSCVFSISNYCIINFSTKVY